jgi:hypothetical protein
LSWIEETHKGVSREFPPSLKIERGKVYIVTFTQPRAKVVIGAFSRKTAVVIVNYEGEKKSLYLSHVDLDRQIANLHDKLGSLDGVTVEIVQKAGVTRGYRYQVTQLSKKPAEKNKTH